MDDEAPPWMEAPYPLQKHLGFEVEEWRSEYCRVVLPLRPFLANRQGLPHGGIHATLPDTAMGYAGCFATPKEDRRFAVTLSLTVNYLDRPAEAATRLLAEAEQTGGGRSTYFARGLLRDDAGTLLAEATSVFRYRPAPTP